MGLALHEMLEALYGVKTYRRENPVTDSVGAAAEHILHGNPMRLSFVVFNLSANPVYIAPSNVVSAAHGFYLAPNGGSIAVSWDIDFELASDVWYGIAPAGASTIYVLENISQ